MDDTLLQLIRQRLEEAAGSVDVDVDYSYETVCISDPSGVQDDIFMQGEGAAAFIAEVENLYEELQDLNDYEAETYVALPYAENLWN